MDQDIKQRARGTAWRVQMLIAAISLSKSGCASTPTVVSEASFAGAWHAKWCDAEDPKRDCGFFNLYLTQERDRICGGHAAATLGLARMDEGEYDSVKGTFHGSVATLVIANTRTGSTHLATATRRGDRLEWKMIGMLTAGSTDEPAIIPRSQMLERTANAPALAALTEIEALPCRWPDEA